MEVIPVFDAIGLANGYNQGRNKSDAKYKIYRHNLQVSVKVVEKINVE